MKKFKGFTLIAALLASIIVPITSSQSASAAQTYSPRWVKNCIYVYDSIAKSHQQQCDQAYATAPGSWKKNCIYVYNSIYKQHVQQCDQAYVPTGRTGSWTKSCTYVYNSSYKMDVQQGRQAFLMRQSAESFSGVTARTSPTRAQQQMPIPINTFGQSEGFRLLKSCSLGPTVVSGWGETRNPNSVIKS